jgi:putative MATE family efflux protein
MEITKGPIWKALLSFFFPILAGTLFQQLYNTVDASVVGQYVGTAALAAVGGTPAVYINLLLGFFLGLSSGAGVLISQFYGANNKASLSQSVHTAIALSLVGGLIITLLGIACTNIMLILTHTPEDVVPLSRLYLTIIFSGTIPTFIYNMGSGILRAVGNSRTPLHIIIVGCVTNIALDLLFVRVLGMGVEGVAFATVICQLMSAVIVMFILLRTHEVYGVKIKDIHFSGHILREMLRIGFPAGIQSSLYTISNLIIQTKFNLFGTKTVAAWAAYGKIDAIFWMTVNAFGIAITTFAGQNAGAGQLSRIKKGMWQTLFMATVATVLFCLSFWFFGTVFFRLFSKEEEVITIGMHILKFMIPWWITYISIEVLSGTIRGTGNSFIPMMITVFGVCALRILWLFTAVRKNSTLNMVMASYPITWIITSIAFWIYYLSGKWIYRSDLLKKKPID